MNSPIVGLSLTVLFCAANVVVSQLLSEEELSTYLPSAKRTILHQGRRHDEILDFMDGVWSVTDVVDSGGIKGRSKDTTSTTAARRRTSVTTTKPFGYSDIPNKIPMSADSHFPIASNTKLYTSVAIYQLYEEGKLDVDADIATMLDEDDFTNFGVPHHKKFCPHVGDSFFSWWRRCETITLRNLLSMSSGIYPPLNCDAEPNAPHQCNPDPYFVSRGSIAATVGTFLFQPLMFRPGTDYHYSNPNFILAAYFVEKYSGMTFRDYLEANIFSRIGLKHTYFDFFNQALGLDDQRVGQYIKYFDAAAEEEAATPHPMAVGADVLQLDLGVASGTGGVVSTIQDHALFWHALFNKTTGGAPLLASPESQKAILTPWMLVGNQDWFPFPNGTISTVWIYYTQGTVIVCDDEGCPNGPGWITYTGGTITVHTANLLDYQTFRMVQVWTSTLVAITDRKSFESAFESQTGPLGEVVNPWLDMEYNNPMAIAWDKMYEGRDTELDVDEVGQATTVSSE